MVGENSEGGRHEACVFHNPQVHHGPVAMLAQADEAEKSEEPREMANGRVDGNITRGIELGRLG